MTILVADGFVLILMPAALLLAAGWIGCLLICFDKGQDTFGYLGIALGFLMFPIGVVIAIVGASQLAKPGSAWAQKRYGPEKMQRSMERFGYGAPDARSSPPPPPPS